MKQALRRFNLAVRGLPLGEQAGAGRCDHHESRAIGDLLGLDDALWRHEVESVA